METIPNIIVLGGNRVWRSYPGGKMLDKMEGRALPKDSHFPEDWIASTTKAVGQNSKDQPDEGISEVTINGQKYLLTDLFRKHPNALLGPAHFGKYGAKTQFLLKYLDSAVRLHIQVHPTISFSKRHLKSESGKTEAYVILDVRKEVKDPFIYLGFQKHVLPEDLKTIVENQDITALTACFEKISIQPGNVFIVPGGIPHAIGPGILMIEIMEPTDFVSRLEFERGGYVLPEEARFMGRGIDFAMEMIHFETITAETIRTNFFCKPRIFEKQAGGIEFVLIDKQQTDCFGVHRIQATGSFIKRADSFYVGIVVEGSGYLKSGNLRISIKRGDRFLVPFSTDSVDYLADDELVVVLAFPPD